MRFINRGRGTGKTTMLVSASYITGIPVLVNTYNQKEHVCQVAAKMNCVIDVFTVEEFRKLRLPYEDVLIDEARSVISDALNYYIGANVVAGTMSVPMEEYKEEG